MLFDDPIQPADMRYLVIFRRNRDDLEAIKALQDRVCRAMREGWRPIGGASVTQGNDGRYTLVQAMIKDKED